ncbi:H+-ATPase G subunit-domain-containing protein [Pholiota molesta]|nr:H+-ATPase G subunit-domain-containing protein [Pholiota molesta]
MVAAGSESHSAHSPPSRATHPINIQCPTRASPLTHVRTLKAAQQSQGVQTLLEAEKEAAKIVQQARQYRVQKLKDARSEATKEIEEYKKAKEQEFKAFETSHAGTTSTTQAALDKETDAKLQEIEVVFQSKKKDVVNTLCREPPKFIPSSIGILRKFKLNCAA